MSEYEVMLDRRKAVVRTLVDDVALGFIALSNEDRYTVQKRLSDHFDNLAHSDALRWRLEPRP